MKCLHEVNESLLFDQKQIASFYFEYINFLKECAYDFKISLKDGLTFSNTNFENIMREINKDLFIYFVI